MRFRRAQHLSRESDIRTVRAQGRRFDCRAFTLWCKTRGAVPPSALGDPSALPPVSPVNVPRVCVIASTSAVGRAVQRNRAKRRLREVFRHQQHCVPSNCDLLLIARSGTATWPMAELERKFVEACGHLAPIATSTGEK